MIKKIISYSKWPEGASNTIEFVTRALEIYLEK